MPEVDQKQAEAFPKCYGSLKELREALASVGVSLPGLRLDPASFGDGDGIPLFDLGRCNMTNAARLVEVLRKGVSPRRDGNVSE
ncbi:hypothetical protein [Streptomyces sp. CoH27]|uniref:hypothetical protein n=1 Tax=Streptomyces sp. CoH27 TaxID=2875763 RepID=UPI001CD3D6CB|nr:hypothetical protein [Streptomyces sp. CoH27]